MECFRYSAEWLQELPENPEELAKALGAQTPTSCGLTIALQEWTKWTMRPEANSGKSAPTASALIHDIKEYAVEARNRGIPMTLGSMDSRLCRGILANAFFGNLEDAIAENGEMKRGTRTKGNNRGGLDFTPMLLSPDLVAVNKVLCLLHYFNSPLTEEDIEFRVCRDTRTLEEFEAFLQQCEIPIRPVQLTVECMEDKDCGTIVNFANSHFGYGRFIQSCTQEEILQMCAPEFNVGMLYFSRIPDDGVITCTGRYFSSYTGYGRSFQCVGPLKSYRQVVVAMDAVMHGHFTWESNLRDIRKATVGFQNSAETISTGKWGCGAFGGDVEHKFLQQLIAASIAGKNVRFSTFKNPAEREKLERMQQTMVAAKCTVRDLYKLLPRSLPSDWDSTLKSGLSDVHRFGG